MDKNGINYYHTLQQKVWWKDLGKVMARRKKISGALLRAMRKETGLTQAQIGQRLGISRETVSAIENEKPETMNSIGAEVFSNWHIICKQSVSSDTRNEFIGQVMSYFGFSEQNLINKVKQLSGTYKKP